MKVSKESNCRLRVLVEQDFPVKQLPTPPLQTICSVTQHFRSYKNSLRTEHFKIKNSLERKQMPQSSGNGLAISSIPHADWKHIAVILHCRPLLKKHYQVRFFLNVKTYFWIFSFHWTCWTSPSTPISYNTGNRQKRHHSYSQSLSHRTEKCSKKHYWDTSKLKPPGRS